MQDKVHAGPQPKLRNKGVGPFGPDAFEKFKGVDGRTSAMSASYARPRSDQHQTGFSKFYFTSFKKAAPVAPSTTRWSHERVTFMRLPGTT